ncbi:S8 family serine peptidase [Aeromicrobium choanae]|uniref:Serine protease n=1 Tax=Aeromicrobium choanae TaxID=1736691 RepID=A0A1T4YUH4_9ACTN|nr:S8 family serine peptidase [Aeromicrobium choanae]SKB05507.1 serine protease [Aeromicrobium choanae]
MRRSLALSALPFLLVASALVSTGASAAPSPEPAGAQSPAAKQAPRVARGLIVKARTASVARRTSLARSADAELPVAVDVATTQSGPQGLSMLRLERPVAVEDLDPAIEAIKDRADVEWVVPDTLRTVSSAPPVSVNDPEFTAQGNLWDTRDEIEGVATSGGYTTKAPALWRATRGSGSVVVAVVDSGITSHPDLAGQTVAGYDFVDDECTVSGEDCFYDESYISAGDGDGWDADPSDPGDWVSEDLAVKCGLPEGEDPADYVSDSSWHGTHVAGTVAAKSNNGIGVAGVAPGVKVQPVRVTGHCGGWDSDIAAGILWSSGYDLREYGVPLNRTPAQVINLSLGGESDDPDEVAAACEYYGEVAEVARANGATLVASAGNASASTIFPLAGSVPASCDGYVSVTATSDTGHRAWYSTAGDGADIAAPGGDQNIQPSSETRGILSTVNQGLEGPTEPGYGWYQGTSMAAPAVAAGAALLYSLGVTSPAAVESRLKAAVQPFSPVIKGSGTILLGGVERTTDTIDCTSSGRTSCGTGILDLSKVTAPLGAPAISGTVKPGGVVRATSRGLTNKGGTSAITWWRGATRIGSGSSYRITGADLGRTLTARDTVVSGSFAGVYRAGTVSVPRTKARARVSMSMPSSLKRTKRARLVVRVSAPLVRPTGTIRVYDGSKRIATKRLYVKNGGKVAILLPKVTKKGKHRIRVVYSGDGVTTSAKSSKVVRVR